MQDSLIGVIVKFAFVHAIGKLGSVRREVIIVKVRIDISSYRFCLACVDVHDREVEGVRALLSRKHTDVVASLQTAIGITSGKNKRRRCPCASGWNWRIFVGCECHE